MDFRASSNDVSWCLFVKILSSTASKSMYLFSKSPSLNLANKILLQASFILSSEICPVSTPLRTDCKKSGPCICISVPAFTANTEASSKFLATLCKSSSRSISSQSLTKKPLNPYSSRTISFIK